MTNQVSYCVFALIPIKTHQHDAVIAIPAGNRQNGALNMKVMVFLSVVTTIRCLLKYQQVADIMARL